MVKKDANLTAIMLVQQLEEEYWLSPDYKEPLQQAKEGNCRPLLELIIKKLRENDIIAKEAYIILHNKDTVTIWNPNELKNEVKNKEEHVHALLKFEKGASLKKIAFAVGIEPQYLERLKSGRYGYPNCLAYLVHAKDENKHQYQPEEVVTVLGEDYVSIYHRSMETWIKGRATKKAKETDLIIDWLIDKILAGEVTKSNIMLTDSYYAIYGQHKRKINEALDTAGERKSYQTIAEMEAGKFKKTLILIQAESGAGKTRLSKKFIALLQKVALKFGQTWDFCVTASTNALDEVNGQEILLLDDLRGSSLTVSDWLKLLDPYMISPISARYHNKMGSSKVIIITSTKKPIDFFEVAKDNVGEDLGQFIRRIDYLLELGDKVALSVPEKQTKPKLDEDKIPWMLPPFASYDFSQKKLYSINEAIDILVKTTIRNMQWNTQKKVINASDQTNNDNPNTQQK